MNRFFFYVLVKALTWDRLDIDGNIGGWMDLEAAYNFEGKIKYLFCTGQGRYCMPCLAIDCWHFHLVV